MQSGACAGNRMAAQSSLACIWHGYPIVTVGVTAQSIGMLGKNLQVDEFTVNSVVCLANYYFNHK